MKNYRNKILLVLIVSVFSSCHKEELGPTGTVIDHGLTIFLKSESNIDLLDPSNPEHFNHNEIGLYYLKNGEVEYVYYGDDYDNPKGFIIDEHSTMGYFISLGLNIESNDEFTITYLKWNKSDTDTLRSQITRKNNDSYVVLEKLWYNEKLVWERVNSSGEWRYLTILK